MKKCMSGCGGKMMSKGGKVAPVKIKKMSTGGSSNPCPKGYHVNEAGGCSENMFHTLGSKFGVGIPLTGAAAIATDAIVKGFKKFNEKRKTKKAAKVASKTTTTTEEKRRGGAMYKSGGIAKQTIVAFPGYNARTDTMKMGGTASLPVCRGGLVRMPDGRCGTREKFKSGGFKDLSGDRKITKKDVLIGRGVIKKPIKKK